LLNNLILKGITRSAREALRFCALFISHAAALSASNLACARHLSYLLKMAFSLRARKMQKQNYSAMCVKPAVL
jgi:hypothetical protein